MCKNLRIVDQLICFTFSVRSEYYYEDIQGDSIKSFRKIVIPECLYTHNFAIFRNRFERHLLSSPVTCVACTQDNLPPRAWGLWVGWGILFSVFSSDAERNLPILIVSPKLKYQICISEICVLSLLPLFEMKRILIEDFTDTFGQTQTHTHSCLLSLVWLAYRTIYLPGQTL